MTAEQRRKALYIRTIEENMASDRPAWDVRPVANPTPEDKKAVSGR